MHHEQRRCGTDHRDHGEVAQHVEGQDGDEVRFDGRMVAQATELQPRGADSLVVARVFATVGRQDAIAYVDSRNFTEPMFVFVIMVIAGTRPILQASGAAVRFIARYLPLPRGMAMYFVVLAFVPLLGSFITEPAAMTLAALMLRDTLLSHQVSTRLKYVTIGVLFVNVSIGGTLTPFAAPPVLMVAAKWNWDMWFMIANFGWKAAVAVVINAASAMLLFRHQLGHMGKAHRPVQIRLGDCFSARLQRRCCLGNVPATAVVETDVQHQPRVAGGRGFSLRETAVRNVLYPLLGRDRAATEALFEVLKNLPCCAACARGDTCESERSHAGPPAPPTPVDGDVAVAWDEAPQTTATGGKVYSFHAQHEPLLVAAGFVVVGRHTRGGSKWILATSPAGFLMRQPLTFGAQAPRQEDFDAYADALHTYYRGHREELPPEEPGKGIVKAIPVTGGQVKYMAERQQSGGKLSQPLQLGAVVAWKAPGVELVRVWSFGAVGHGRTSASSFNPRAA